VTVKNTGGSGELIVALFSERSSPRFSHVRVVASGGAENQAIHISSAPVLDHLVASASGGGTAIGVANFNGALTVSNSTFAAADAVARTPGFSPRSAGPSGRPTPR
jgi:microcystin-dependent protein